MAFIESHISTKETIIYIILGTIIGIIIIGGGLLLVS